MNDRYKADDSEVELIVRRIGEPVAVSTRQQQPVTFVWRGVTYHVRIIGSWRLATRWWEASAAVDRVYFRVQTADQQIFELFREAGGQLGDRWILDICQD